MILLIRQFRDLAHDCRAARTRVLNIFNTWPGWLENLFDKVLEPAFCTASSTPWSADTLMTALKGPRVVGSAWGFNAGWGNHFFSPNIYLANKNIWESPIIGAGRRSNTSNIGANHHKSTINKSTSCKTSYPRTCLLRLRRWWRNPFGGWSCCPGVGPWMASLMSFQMISAWNFFSTPRQETYYLGAGFCDHQPRWGGFIFKMWK